MRTTTFSVLDALPEAVRDFPKRRAAELIGLSALATASFGGVALLGWRIEDPSLSHATGGLIHNFLGYPGAVFADLAMQSVGLASVATLAPVAFWGWRLVSRRSLPGAKSKLAFWLCGVAFTAGFVSMLPTGSSWPLPVGLGGLVGDAFAGLSHRLIGGGLGRVLVALAFGGMAGVAIVAAVGRSPALGVGQNAPPASKSPGRIAAKPAPEPEDEDFEPESGFFSVTLGAALHGVLTLKSALGRTFRREPRDQAQIAPPPWMRAPAPPIEDASAYSALDDYLPNESVPRPWAAVSPPMVAAPPPRAGLLEASPRSIARADAGAPPVPPPLFTPPNVALLAETKKSTAKISDDSLEQNARMLENVLDDFGVKGEIINVRPGPVVTLYELEPAPGVKSSRVIGLADDIARSMSAVSARVAVVQGRNAIGIELPNQKRETVYLREMFASQDFENSKHKLAIALGKTIGGEPVIVDLAKMPHLLVAGTTGSGKSVAINTMILSLLYRLSPAQCRLIMVDPKMLELSVYDGIPHLLTPVVTDPKKAVVALKWAVREMEDRYKKMSKLGVRNIDGFNARVVEAAAKGEAINRTVQTGFDRETGEAVYEQERMDLSELPYIVVIVDEMADLMMVAGKDIEGAIQRLAQMARAAGIHLIMATQRPSVDVITGTIKANFPTRISFQVTSKIDSRTILGEQGAEQLLGQGDMLYMAGGGRISRVHGPFVADPEVEKIVAYLKTQGAPEYLTAITEDEEAAAEDEDSGPPPDAGSMDAEESADLYDRAVSIVLRDRKVSTSYIQRRLSVGYNKAASLVERMEKEGVVGAANHAGKREILIDRGAAAFADAQD